MRTVARPAPGAPAPDADARGGRGILYPPLAALALAALAWTGCTQSHGERQKTLDRSGEVDQTVASSAVVRELRAPTDTGGIIYSAPTNLAQQPAAPAGTPDTTSTKGASAPDSTHAKEGSSAKAGRSR